MSTSEPQPDAGATPIPTSSTPTTPTTSPDSLPPAAPAASESPLHATRGAAARAAAAHAAERPAPTPPETEPEPARTSRVDPADVAASAPSSAMPSPAPRHAPESPDAPVIPPTGTDSSTTTAPSKTPDTSVPVEPVAPRTTGAGGHTLGALVGLVLGLVAIAVALVGQSRILGVQTDGWDASLDIPGIVLVIVGALLLGALVWLGLWSAAVPITAGVVTTGLGSFFLIAPGIARTETMNALATTNSHDTVTRATVAGTSGTMLLVGFLLLVAGLALAVARRRGRVLGEFRERNRTS